MWCCCGSDEEEILVKEVASSNVLVDSFQLPASIREVKLNLEELEPKHLGIEVDNTDAWPLKRCVL